MAVSAAAEVNKETLFVPITINYDRIYDSESFPLELLGESRP
jgi:hypothetical protein